MLDFMLPGDMNVNETSNKTSSNGNTNEFFD